MTQLFAILSASLCFNSKTFLNNFFLSNSSKITVVFISQGMISRLDLITSSLAPVISFSEFPFPQIKPLDIKDF